MVLKSKKIAKKVAKKISKKISKKTSISSKKSATNTIFSKAKHENIKTIKLYVQSANTLNSFVKFYKKLKQSEIKYLGCYKMDGYIYINKLLLLIDKLNNLSDKDRDNMLSECKFKQPTIELEFPFHTDFASLISNCENSVKYKYDISVKNLYPYVLENVNAIVKVINTMDSIFLQAPKINDDNLILYRGVKHIQPYCKVDFYSAKVGDVITIPTYMSCSSDYDTSSKFANSFNGGDSVILCIKKTNNCPYIYLPWSILNIEDDEKISVKTSEKIGEYLMNSEHEYLLPRGCKLKVDKVYIEKLRFLKDNSVKYNKSDRLINLIKKKFKVVSDTNPESDEIEQQTTGINADDKSDDTDDVVETDANAVETDDNIMSGGGKGSGNIDIIKLSEEHYVELENIMFKNVKIIETTMIDYINPKKYKKVDEFRSLLNFTIKLRNIVKTKTK